MRQASRSADWIGLEEAIARIIGVVRPLSPEDVAIEAGIGRVLAEDVSSAVDLPPWRNSAMDGFAVHGSDVAGASKANPVTLRIVDDIPAGAFPARALGKGEAARIMTGAPLPDSADSVIRVEHTTQQDGSVVIHSDTDCFRNVREKGEDVRAGSRVLGARTLIRPAEIGLLASVGRANLRVHRRPRVAILATGDELVDVSGFDQVAAGRRIVNSNSYALAAAATSMGCEPLVLGIARDDEQHLRDLMTRGLDADALVVTAGASVGEHDLVKDVLEELGVHTHFWRVRIRPGSPFSFGTRGDTPVFGLPGNPVSALVTFEILVKPALRRMLGRTALHTPVVTARLAATVRTTTGLTQFMRVKLDEENGTLVARLTGPQGSGILSSVVAAQGLMVVPENVAEIEAGSDVKVVRLTSSDETQLQLGFQTRMTS